VDDEVPWLRIQEDGETGGHRSFDDEEEDYFPEKMQLRCLLPEQADIVD